MKRLRYYYPKQNIRYYHCGEYGEKLSRPHYHAILFGIDFHDLEYHSKTNGFPVFKSADLESIWGKGFCTVGNVTWESAAYVARYCTKKINGHKAHEHYFYCCPLTGELHRLDPEYSTMSLKPGIGADWLETYMSDVYPLGTVIVNGKEHTTPAYYDKLFERWNPKAYEQLKLERAREARLLEAHPDNTPRRLKTREKCHDSQAKLLKRSYEAA